MSTVWIIADRGGQDFSDARHFGTQLRELFTTQSPLQLKEAYRHALATFIRDSQPSDFLLLTGQTVLIAAATAAWLTVHKQLNVLAWHAVQRRYLPMDVKIEEQAALVKPPPTPPPAPPVPVSAEAAEDYKRRMAKYHKQKGKYAEDGHFISDH